MNPQEIYRIARSSETQVHINWSPLSQLSIVTKNIVIFTNVYKSNIARFEWKVDWIFSTFRLVWTKIGV